MAAQNDISKVTIPFPRQEESVSFVGVMQGVAALPAILDLLREQRQQIAALHAALREPHSRSVETNGWLDAKGAAAYLGISAGSFDKYRYQTTPRIEGYPLDGKTLYKKSELDNFVRLYALKSRGLA